MSGGIIPACAGSTTRTMSAVTATRDHPRMCGEHLGHMLRVDCPQGSSPHVRGALMVSLPSEPKRGIIPACAGSTMKALQDALNYRDHPRMCGEHSISVMRPNLLTGSSPHVRGARGVVSTCLLYVGIIPACAGSTQRAFETICGQEGSSPHVRGARIQGRVVGLGRGIIPACAGSTEVPAVRYFDTWDHPRMCGEHTSKIA